MIRARALTFHIDGDELAELTAALDDVAEQYVDHPDFRGLLCMEHDSVRSEIVVITLWEGQGLENTQAVSEAGRRRIAATTDLGVISKCYDVLRIVPGPAALRASLRPSSVVGAAGTMETDLIAAMAS
ncbi:MAG: hypothetical protein ABSG81_08145 [Acidimicrobiales bacterium]|jgi:hypothetical protein